MHATIWCTDGQAESSRTGRLWTAQARHRPAQRLFPQPHVVVHTVVFRRRIFLTSEAAAVGEGHTLVAFFIASFCLHLSHILTLQKHAQQLIDNFLNAFAKLPMDKLSDEECLLQVQQLKDTLKAQGSGDSTIQRLLEGY